VARHPAPPQPGRMRSRSPAHISVQDLRAELDRFARENLQQELTSFRDHLETSLRRELHSSQRWNFGSKVFSVGEEEEKEEVFASERDEAAVPQDSDSACFAPGSVPFGVPASERPPGKESTPPKRRAVDFSWASRRAGFRKWPDDDSRNFGRRRMSQLRHQSTSSGNGLRTSLNNAYSFLGQEEPGPAPHSDGAVTQEVDNDSGSMRGSRDMALVVGEDVATRPSLSVRVWRTMEALLTSESFDYWLGGLIVLNAVVIGMETQYMAAHWCTELPPFYRIVDWCFCFIFLVEVVMRLCCGGCGFFVEPGWMWNVFDLMVVILQIFDEGIRHVTVTDIRQKGAEELKDAAASQLGSMRVLRLFRLLRLLRLTRMLYLLGGLRMLVVSIADSLRSLAWTLCLLFALTYVFGVFCTQLVTDYKVQHTDSAAREEMEDLLYYFGSLDRAMLCLYETISEGLHWSEVVKPLMEQCGEWLALIFVIYMSFTLFALMNVVTGVFCESAIRTAEEDKKQVLMQQMQTMFVEADDDGSGTISLEEFEGHLKDPQMLSYLKAIDVNPEEARHLFAILDTDGSGEIEAEVLVNGCLRLQGSAKAIELAAFMQEHKVGHQRLMDHADIVERSLSYLCENLPNRAEMKRVYGIPK